MSSTTTIQTTTTTDIRSHRPNRLAIYTMHVLGQHARTALWWAIGLSGYTAAMVASFPALQESGTLDVTAYPESLREAFSLETLDAIEPYLSSQVYTFAPLLLGFFPILIFAGAVAGAEERGSLDLILGIPLTRVQLVVVLAFLGGSSWLVALAMDVDFAAPAAFGAAFNVLPITMLFGGVALVLSTIVRRRAVAVGVPVALLFISYLFDTIGRISDALEWLRIVSAFRYYGDAIQEGVAWAGAAGLSIVAVGLLVASLRTFAGRDVYS